MTSLRKIAAIVTCVAMICGAAILWPVYKGKATERKLAEAAKVIRVRAEQGEAKAQDNLASMYYYGQGVPQDYTEAVRWLRKAADQGYAKAQSNLASMYYYGKGVPPDYTEAVRWYRRAADQGYAKAQFNLASMYYYGQGVPPDYTEAVRWYRKAADQGDATAQSYLGFSYFHGQGVPQDHAEAVRWYRKAGDQGDRTALGFLTVFYFKGQGVPKDYTEALHWLGKLAASCFVRAQGGPLARWTSVVALLVALLILVVPQRRWGRATWLPWALCSASCAAPLIHHLLLSESPSFGRVLWLALLAGCSAICALMAIVSAARGSKRGGGPLPTPGAPQSSDPGAIASLIG